MEMGKAGAEKDFLLRISATTLGDNGPWRKRGKRAEHYSAMEPWLPCWSRFLSGRVNTLVERDIVTIRRRKRAPFSVRGLRTGRRQAGRSSRSGITSVAPPARMIRTKNDSPSSYLPQERRSTRSRMEKSLIHSFTNGPIAATFR